MFEHAILFALLAALGGTFRPSLVLESPSPRASASLGLHSRHTTYHSRAVGDVTNRDAAVLANLSLGTRVARRVASDVSLRTTLGTGVPFRALTLGVSVLSNPPRGVYFRLGAGAVQGYEPWICVAEGTAGPPCSGYSAEWKFGLDVSAGLQLLTHATWSVGPTIWYAQSLGGFAEYGSAGLGLAVAWQ